MVSGPGQIWCVEVWDPPNTYTVPTMTTHYLTGTSCQDLTDIQNGVISYNTISANGYRRLATVATYSCTAAGFDLTGNSMRTCGVSGWDGTAPTCTGEDC